MEPQDLIKYSSGSLSFLGDAVFSLLAREKLVKESNVSLGEHNRKIKDYVSAKAQNEIYRAIVEFLTDEEAAVMKRGRNVTSQSRAKNATVSQYRHATGVEALFGWLYLLGRHGRIGELFEKCVIICEKRDKCNGKRPSNTSAEQADKVYSKTTGGTA
jgi:ribonuclease-3 family protein